MGLGVAFVYFLLAGIVGLGGSAECEEPWIAFKDEVCVQLFLNDVPEPLKTYEGAVSFCKGQAPETQRPSLPVIKSQEYQDFIDKEIIDKGKIMENVWLDAVFNETGKAEWTWSDGDVVSYDNWAENYPREPPRNCSELVSPFRSVTAKWQDVSCEVRNAVICQKLQLWTIDEVAFELIKLRNRVDALSEKK